MLKVVLVDPPAPDCMINPMPVLGLGILRTFLESKGYEVETIDLAIRVRYLNRFFFRRIFNLKLFDNDERIINFLNGKNDDALKDQVEKMIRLGRLTDYDVIGFNFVTINVRFALCLAKVLKEDYDKKIILGSALTSRTDHSDLLKFDFVDFLIVGDGEEPFLRILKYFESGETIENCAGIFYKKDGKIHRGMPTSFPIEEKANPSFNPDDLKLHKKLSVKGLSILPYLISRGCKYKCAFCFEYKNTFFEYKPVEKVVSDIKSLKAGYNTNFIFFVEGNLNNDPAYMKTLSERIIYEKLNIWWGGFATITGLNEEIIKVMAQSGCKLLMIGVESGSEIISSKMNLQKKKDFEKFKETLKLLHKYGVGTHCFYIVEFPYETNEDFQKNLDFIKETAKYTTTAAASAYQLLENSTAFLVPKILNIKIRERNSSKYNFFDRFWKFDEIDGLKWEEKSEKGQIKEKITLKTIFKEIELRFILKSLLKNPLYIIRKKISYPYISYDEYFI